MTFPKAISSLNTVIIIGLQLALAMKNHRRTAPHQPTVLDSLAEQTMKAKYRYGSGGMSSGKHSKMLNSSNARRNVRFDNITLFEFQPVLGDSPSVSSGVPVALSPTHMRQTEVSIDLFEAERRNERRTLIELLIEESTRSMAYVK
jgi:hypothetical protein